MELSRNVGEHTQLEKDILIHLSNAYNLFVTYSGAIPSEQDEFCRIIHQAQYMVAFLAARRANPDIYGLR
jgi:hypothetical protein